ncbi:hypothetical protein [Streptomyces odontomachi]|uniref:hypothetical protein n=1 Tax=Streptomyces odontomachi TaxID=2944940 RepID=UPI00210EA7F9|nr:hypothetical protein [Streptomyces sp. ODS25]
MSAFSRFTRPGRSITAAGAVAALALALAACGTSHDSSSMPGMDHGTKTTAPASPKATSSTDGMPGMGTMATGNGLSAGKDGYRLASQDAHLPAGEPVAYRFTVNGPDGSPVTGFSLDQTKRMHFYAVRSDLTGFQHVHPVMADSGTWSADLASLTPGSWRMFASFTPADGPGKGKDFVLSRTVTVPGNATKTPLPAPAASAEVDGYTVTVKGELMAGMAHPLTVSVSRGGAPVTNLEPYLDSYAHLTAFHEGDSAFAHLHPTTGVDAGHGGPRLPFHAELPTAGNWRLFLQFQTGGKLHTTALTLHVG